MSLLPNDPATTAMVMAALLPLHQTVINPMEIAVRATASWLLFLLLLGHRYGIGASLVDYLQ